MSDCLRGALIAMLCLLGCGGPIDGHHQGGAGLAWSLASHPEVQIQVTRPGLRQHVWLADAAVRWASELGLNVQFLEDGQEPSSHRSRIVVGCVGDAVVDDLLRHLGVKQKENHWSYGNLGARTSEAWLVATFKDPDGSGLPVTLLCAQEEQWLEPGLKRLQPGTFPMLRLYSGAFPVLETELNSRGQLRQERWSDCRPWFRQPKGVVEHRRQRYKNWRIDSAGECQDEDLRARVDAIENTWANLAQWAPITAPKAPKLFGQANAYQWRFSDDPSGWTHVDAYGHQVQALILAGHAGDGGAGVGRAYLAASLGPAAQTWLCEAASLQASGVYWGVPLDEWWARLARLAELPTPQKLISGQGLEGVSPHLVTPMRALLVQVVLEQDARQLLRLWKEGQEVEAWKPWFAVFGERLGELAAQPRGHVQPRPMGQWKTRLGASMEGGLDLDGPGLASELHHERLLELASVPMGTVAYTMSLSRQPLASGVRCKPLRPRTGLHDVRSESLLLLSLARAKGLGMAIALELEIWAAPSGVLLQDLVWPSRSEVEIFFQAYGRGALHAALFSSLAGVELLCLGDAMGEVVRTEARESELQDTARLGILRLRSQSWARLIQTTRSVFPGALTLSVSNTRAVSTTDVWSRLDAIGINLFLGERSLVQSGGGAPATLLQRWGRELARAAEVSGGQPYVLWAVGKSPFSGPGRGMELAGMSAWKAQSGRALQAFGGALGEMQETAPRACFLSPVGLDSLSGGLDLGYQGVRKAIKAFSSGD